VGCDITNENTCTRIHAHTHAYSQMSHLVGNVKEGQVALALAQLCDLGPLLWGGVNAGGVVGATVQEDNRACAAHVCVCICVCVCVCVRVCA